jgi:hypothetical protein
VRIDKVISGPGGEAVAFLPEAECDEADFED